MQLSAKHSDTEQQAVRSAPSRLGTICVALPSPPPWMADVDIPVITRAGTTAAAITMGRPAQNR